MFKVGQRYRILKPFCTGARLGDELEGLVGTCIEILGVDGGGESWFHEYDDGRKDWLFAVDVWERYVELVEEKDILKQKLDEYNLKSLHGVTDLMFGNDEYLVGREGGFVDILRRSLKSDRYIKFPDSDLEQVIVALTALLEDK